MTDTGQLRFGRFQASLFPPCSSFLLALPSSCLLPPSSFLLPPSSLLPPPSSFLLPPSSPFLSTFFVTGRSHFLSCLFLLEDGDQREHHFQWKPSLCAHTHAPYIYIYRERETHTHTDTRKQGNDAGWPCRRHSAATERAVRASTATNTSAPRSQRSGKEPARVCAGEQINFCFFFPGDRAQFQCQPLCCSLYFCLKAWGRC